VPLARVLRRPVGRSPLRPSRSLPLALPGNVSPCPARPLSCAPFAPWRVSWHNARPRPAYHLPTRDLSNVPADFPRSRAETRMGWRAPLGRAPLAEVVGDRSTAVRFDTSVYFCYNGCLQWCSLPRLSRRDEGVGAALPTVKSPGAPLHKKGDDCNDSVHSEK